MKNIQIIAFISALLFQYSLTSAQDVVEGEKIFNSTCKACHSVGKGKVVGPDLIKVHERRDEEWLQKFISSPKKMIESKDPYAVKLFEENNKILMPDHPLRKTDIQNILAFIKGQSTPAQTEAPQVIKVETKPEIVKAELSTRWNTSDYLAYSLLGICFILISFVIILLYQISNAFKIKDNNNSHS
jgi:hypothetical protein